MRKRSSARRRQSTTSAPSSSAPCTPGPCARRQRRSGGGLRSLPGHRRPACARLATRRRCVSVADHNRHITSLGSLLYFPMTMPAPWRLEPFVASGGMQAAALRTPEPALAAGGGSSSTGTAAARPGSRLGTPPDRRQQGRQQGSDGADTPAHAKPVVCHNWTIRPTVHPFWLRNEHYERAL